MLLLSRIMENVLREARLMSRRVRRDSSEMLKANACSDRMTMMWSSLPWHAPFM